MLAHQQYLQINCDQLPAERSELQQPMASTAKKQAASRTVVRLAQIQNRLTTAPRTGKLRGKVAVITGVGSLKGIG